MSISRLDPRVMAIQNRVVEVFSTSRSGFSELSSLVLSVVTVFCIENDTRASKLMLRALEVTGSDPSGGSLLIRCHVMVTPGGVSFKVTLGGGGVCGCTP